MPAKKKSDAIEVSKEKQDLINAIATGNTEGVDLSAVQDLLDALGMKAVAKGIQGVKTSRVEVQRRWLTATELSEDERKSIERLPEVIGSTPIFTSEEDVRDFTQAEVDSMVQEMDTMRPVQDIVEGRRQALRSTAFDIITLRNGDDPNATGDLSSPKHGKKITVGKQVRKGEPNYEALKQVVDEEVWKAIVSEEVTVTYKVDEEKLAEALGDGRVTLEQFAALVPEEKVSRVFSLKDLKEGDAV
jgi:uncharacterized protein (DUF2384 family)